MRDRLRGFRGDAYWRALDELAEGDALRADLAREFPDGASEWTDPVSRRRFLSIMGASLALAGAGACAQPPAERIVPYVNQPEPFAPGKPLFFATAMPFQGYGIGVLAESHLGRPTKIEGNDRHPASLGATDAIVQASVLELYDPDRSQVIKNGGQISTWEAFLADVAPVLARVGGQGGVGLHLVTGTVTSPSLAAEIARLRSTLPDVRWHRFEPVGRDEVHAGTRLAFGETLEPRYHFDRADVIVCLDADVLGVGPARVRHARDLAARRDPSGRPSRLYVVEPTPSISGAFADHRLPASAWQVDRIARALARRVGVAVAAEDPPGIDARWLDAMAEDLVAHRGASLVVAGDCQPAAVHALAHAMNAALGNTGATVTYTAPVEMPADGASDLQSLRELVDALAAGLVDLLVILESNPVYTAPADLDFATHLRRATLCVHLGLYDDETAELCQWHIPAAHYLESWGDLRAFDGTVTVLQPLIEPLYGGRTALEIVTTLAGQSHRTSHEMVREYWQAERPDDFETFWQRSLHDGIVEDSVGQPRPVRPAGELAASLPPPPPIQAPGTLEVVFRPDPSVFDGRYANNAWLQELPKPLTKLAWDNAILVSPSLAAELNLTNEQIVDLELDGRAVSGPVWIQPGQAADSITVHLGYGRRRTGRVGRGAGFSAYDLRTTTAFWSAWGARLRPTRGRSALASVQGHHRMEGRHLVREASFAAYGANPAVIQEAGHDPPPSLSLYPAHAATGPQWGMAIDLNVCIGCNACVVACQAENNIPAVGKTEVVRGREMHWIRVDRYFAGPPDDPSVVFQPVPCMHCENAPCEVVCPTAATVHSPDGLNEMVYNRCVGTRYCANNCPYKVRRFNFLQYVDSETPVLKLLRNPEVTVRSRGVMEKCTYCVQRIRTAQITAGVEDRELADGEIQTACQQACPSRAIVFGDISDPGSRVARLKAEARNYGLLTELNTRPRTTYLARLRNPNPRLVGEE